LAATGKVDIMRAGIWKPRTSPGSFEGIGTKGLPWLQQARKASGLPVAVEVATGKQVEDALHFDVDVLWIGASAQRLTLSACRKLQMPCVVWMCLC
jgi:chorismate mutase